MPSLCASRTRLAALVLVGGLISGAGGVHAAGDDERPSAPGKEPSLDLLRASVSRALPLLVKAGAEEYPRHRACFSCHNQAVPALAISLARQHGFAVNAETLQSIAEHTEADLATAIDDYRKGKGQPGGVIRAGYALMALEAAGWEPDETTAAVAHYLAEVPGRRDHWLSQSQRPPSESSDFTATVLCSGDYGRTDHELSRRRARKFRTRNSRPRHSRPRPKPGAAPRP